MTRELVSSDPPIAVAVLTSKSASRLRYLLEDDPNRGRKYEIVAGFSNDEENETMDLFEENDIPAAVNDISTFYEERGADLSDMEVRAEFDRATMAFLSEYDPDLIVLAGYLHIVSQPMIDEYWPRMINIHHADLTLSDDEGNPRYPGLTSVRDAVMNGEPRTHETTHILTGDVDAGPLLVRSPPFETNLSLIDYAREHDEEDVLKAYAFAHREWMIRAVGGRTLAKTIELVADGHVKVSDGEVYLDHDQTVVQMH
ncbi:MAG: phosphoribosylglycinamide formyltransferase [Halodesulfurarchaeum sp.]